MQKLEADGLHWLYAFLESMVWADQFDEHEADLEIFCFVLLFSISFENFFLLSFILFIFLSRSHYPVILFVSLYYSHLINFLSLLCCVIWLLTFYTKLIKSYLEAIFCNWNLLGLYYLFRFTSRLLWEDFRERSSIT